MRMLCGALAPGFAAVLTAAWLGFGVASHASAYSAQDIKALQASADRGDANAEFLLGALHCSHEGGLRTMFPSASRYCGLQVTMAARKRSKCLVQ